MADLSEEQEKELKDLLLYQFNNTDVGQNFMQFKKDEELDYLYTDIVNEVKVKYDPGNCTIIPGVAEKCNVDEITLYQVLRVFAGFENKSILQPFKIEKEESKLQESKLQNGSRLNVLPGQTGKKSRENVFGMETHNVLSIDWTGHTDEDMEGAKNYINKQCGNTINHKDIITLVTIGRRNGLDLVPLLLDIYTYYKYKDLSDTYRSKMTIQTFCGASKVLKSLEYKDNNHKDIYEKLRSGLGNFQTRLNPEFNINNPTKIDDDINPYITYTLAVSNMLQNVLETQPSSPIPLAVDLWIIPLNVKEVMFTNADDSDEDSDEDEDESDSDDDEEEKEDTLTTDFTPNLRKYQTDQNASKFEVATLEDNGDSIKDKKTLEIVFKKILNNSKRSVKLNIIIDRRKKKDNLLIYQLPLQYSAIVNNYCNETLIYSTANHIMFDIDNTILNRGKIASTSTSESETNPGESCIFGANFGCDGKMFLISFGLQENQTRMTFWRHGSAVRFWPQYMTQMWPRLFINAKINKLYTEEYIANHFGLKYKDELFDAWYNEIVDFDK